jgi:hypothetical protein
MIRGHRNEKQRKETSDRLRGVPSFFKGKHHTDEAKEKLRQANLGRKDPPWLIEKRAKAIRGKTGHPVSEKTKEILREYKRKQYISPESQEKARNRLAESKSKKMKLHWSNPDNRAKHTELIRKYILKGENAPRWLGGLSYKPYTSDFNKDLKNNVRSRDKYICQLCSKTEKNNNKSLTCHHIDYDKDNSVESNLISLCVACNSKVNNDREYWSNYFSQMLLNNIRYEEIYS